MNSIGKLVIPLQFEDGYDFLEGLAPVLFDGLWGYVNNAGEFAVPPTFPGSDEGGNKLVTVTQHSEGLAAVSKTDKWGFINLLGTMTIEPQFDSAMSFSEGLAGVYEGDKLGYIDHSGKFVIEPQFANGTSFSEGRAGVEIDGLWGFIDSSGREIIHPRFQSCNGFSEGLALTQDNPDSTMQGSFGFIDGAGNWAIQTGDPWWFSDFHSGWARKSEQFDLKLGFINHSAEVMIAAQEWYISDFSEGLAAVNGTKPGDDQVSFVNRVGKPAFELEPQIIWADDFRDGLARVLQKKQYGPGLMAGYVDLSGKYVWKPREFCENG